MYSLSDIAFWFSLIAILISFLVAFYIPGRVILGEKAIKQEGALHVFSIVVGIAMFAWQGYLFGILQLRWLTYLYIAVFVGLYIYKRYYSNIKISLSSFRKIDPLILVIGFFGIGAQILPYLQMGLKTQQGITLINNNLGDHIWHGGLIAELVDHFPPSEPGMAGIILKDYHYWFSLVTAELIRVFNLPELLTQFLGMYLLASVLLLFVGYYFAKLIYNNK